MKRILITLIAIAGIIIGRAQQSLESDSLALLKSELEYVNAKLADVENQKKQLAKEKKWLEIWRNGRYTMLAYAPSASTTEYGLKSDASLSLAIAKGNQYFFNKHPFGGMVKVGLDMRWTEVSFIKYKKIDYETTDGWIDDDDDSGIFDMFSNLGRYDLHVSAFGFGPVVSVAPFTNFDNAARYLRATLYFHYKPTFGLHLVSEDGEMDSSVAYCNMMDFGGKIQYRGIAFGVESNWGNGKYSQISSLFGSDDENDDEPMPKIKRKFSQCRIFLAFSF